MNCSKYLQYPHHFLALGQALARMADAGAYRELTVGKACELILPPIRLGQYYIEHDRQGRPDALAFWAYPTESGLARLKASRIDLDPDQWVGGTAGPYLVDTLAGDADRARIEAKVKAARFADTPLHVVDVEDGRVCFRVLE